jgi:PAS domain S-box-containing protein
MATCRTAVSAASPLRVVRSEQPRTGETGAPAGLALASLRQQVDLLLGGAQEGVYGVDREGRATMVTPSVAAMTGHALSDLVGRSMHELLHHSHEDGQGYPQAECPIYAAFRDGQTHHAQEVFWRKDGSSFPIEYTSTPLVQAGEVVGAVVVFRDLSLQQDLRDRASRVLDAVLGAGMAATDPPGLMARPTRAAVMPWGESPAWRAAMDLVRRVAPVDTTVLLQGESGTGKELVARALHGLSPRHLRPLVTVNCAALPASLIESELFGHERGAFTGASAQRIGRFEQADDGTLFLDEVGELPPEAQAKLLRVLQEREFERVGGTRTFPCRARIVAATNRDLPEMAARGRFRADLLHRLNVFPITLPPLRQRRDDIPLLARHFIRKLEPRLGRQLLGFSPAAERHLRQYDWPGNVRELENVVERAALLADGPLLEVPPLQSPPHASLPSPTQSPTPRGLDRDETAIRAALIQCGWKVTGPRGAAAVLAVHPNTLRNRMRALGITRP